MKEARPHVLHTMIHDLSAVPILVFARAPAAGSCKTRLIPRYGRRGAAKVYRKLVQRTIRSASAAGCGPLQLWATPATSHPYFTALRRQWGLVLRRQPGGDLGRRMSRALSQVLREGAPAALLVGTDAANLGAEDLRAAARALLDGADAVLQPAADGGYVLIGLRRPVGSALQGVNWSSGREFRQTRTRLIRRGLSVASMPERWDIDHPSDLRRARRERLI